MGTEDLHNKYSKVPIELKQMRRWVCYRVEKTEDGKLTKRPYNGLSGQLARVNDSLTWTTFDLAVSGCIKFRMNGLGFILGDGIFGIDLDNHPDVNGEYPMTDEEFKTLSDEFIQQLDSYTEYSQSGKGVHIICRGNLPEGSRRKDCVEMYDKGRFFAFTGNVIHNVPIKEGSEAVVPLWEKYVKTEIVVPTRPRVQSTISFTDTELIDKICQSKSGADFQALYYRGDTSSFGYDHSAADLGLCSILAFWTNSNKAQMDSIFRTSALYRDKWDENRGGKTYGDITLDKAVSTVITGYVPTPMPRARVELDDDTPVPQVIQTPNGNSFEVDMNIDENGEPIFKDKEVFGSFTLTDTGNAMRFYAYFGEYFKYNVTDKVFMFWTGKTWLKDTKNIIKKYANKFIEILKAEEKKIEAQINEKKDLGEVLEVESLKMLLQAMQKNTTRVGNKAGKEAMLSELQSLYDIPVESSEFNKDDYLLNTESGIVNLKSGEITAFDKNKMCSKNTNIKVSYEKPEVWLQFLHSIFYNGNEAETQEIIDSLQTCLGYSLTGSTREQVMFLLYGKGSNGKSTLTEEMSYLLGDYGDNIKSDVLMQQKNGGSNSTFSIAKLQTTRFVETGETDDGGKLAEAQVKILTGGDTISAQFKFGNEFSFKPKFKLWMSTNNPPIIRGTDYGIWRRIFMFPFTNIFTDEQKDKDLPLKLRAESDKILGWCIQGYQIYAQKNGFIVAKSIQNMISSYKQKMDVVARFIDQECVIDDEARINSKELFRKYKEWAEDNSDYSRLSEAKFCENLVEKGIKTERSSVGTMYYVGIDLNGFRIVE